MVVKVPGTQRQFALTPLKLLGVLLLLVPLVWLTYLLVNVWRTEAAIHETLPDTASVSFTPEPQGTQPVLIFPTAKATGTASASTTPEAARPRGVPTPYNAGQQVPNPTASQPTPASADSSIKDWNGKKRINVLLLGLDQREDEGTRPDTIMLASLDFENNRAYVLSIPRDLYVNVPGFQYHKINAAYAIGENPEHTKKVNGGLGLMLLTLRSNFGIKSIDAHARVSFEAFVTGVDQIGGIDIVVPKRLVDRQYPEDGKKIRVIFEKGPQHMNGERALKYARIRHTDNDFGRIQRQQQVLLSIQQKARTPATILKAPGLLGVIKDNVKTSLSAREQIRLARWGASLPRENIEFYTLQGRIGTTEQNESVVRADKREADATLDRVFGPNEAEFRP